MVKCTAKLVRPPQCSLDVQSMSIRRERIIIVVNRRSYPEHLRCPFHLAVQWFPISNKARSKRWSVGCHRSPLLRSSSSPWSPTHRVLQAQAGCTLPESSFVQRCSVSDFRERCGEGVGDENLYKWPRSRDQDGCHAHIL